jgi:hypothetical protein
MSPQEFKQRFNDAYGDLPEGVELDLGMFRDFDLSSIEDLRIPEDARRFLAEVGFPEESAPFLSFTYNFERLSDLQPSLGDEFNSFRVFGSNGSGDYISLNERDGSICYHNHDDNMRKVFINSSLQQFAEALCLMTEAVESDYSTNFIALLASIDKDASREDAFWTTEYQMMKG